jgi:hypothetical protein
MAAEYKRHAEECRRLARHMAVPEDKRSLEEVANAWEILARLRSQYGRGRRAPGERGDQRNLEPLNIF